MKTIFAAAFAIFLLSSTIPGNAQPPPPDGCTNCILLDAWYFPDTNWLSYYGYSPVNFSNVVNLFGENGDSLLLDTTNLTPAFLFYNVVDTNSDSTTWTNITPSAGTISLWANFDWSSTNQPGGTGPGNYANLISMGQTGTNGPWWAWYLSPDGCTAIFAAQTNGGSASVYLSAPVSLLTTNWYNLVLSYGPTNSAFFTNGVLVTNGTGVTNWPGSNVTFFSIGSDSNGLFQARGTFSDLETYNYQFDSNTVWEQFGLNSLFYGLAGSGTSQVQSAPSTNTSAPTFDAVTGPGFLIANGASATYATNANVWITNYTATYVSTNVVNLNFAVAGGSNAAAYDVFATSAFARPVTNTTWYWMGQAYRGTNYTLPITNSPPGPGFIILGTPQDRDHDGLTDAYELLVSHTNPTNSSTSGDGILDGWKIVWGLNPLTNNLGISSERLNYGYDPASRLDQVSGVLAETIGIDGEENVLSAH
jgi:hypothetical protein